MQLNQCLGKISHFRKDERFKINNPSFYFKKLGKEQIKLKISERKKIIKIRAEVIKTEISVPYHPRII